MLLEGSECRRATPAEAPPSPVVLKGRGWSLVPVAAAACAVLLCAGAAPAHQQGVSYSDVTVEGGRVRYDLTIANHDLPEVDANGDGVLTDEEVLARYPSLRRLLERGVAVEAGGSPCPLRLEDFSIDPRGAVTFRLRGPCRAVAPLRVVFRLLALAGTAGNNFAKIRFGSVYAEHVFGRDDVEAVIGEATSLAATFQRFFLLGIEHIATGYDHMLFLVALLLVGGGMHALLGIVTAFTLAHSLTLALATLDLVSLPSRPVEAAIALSIAWVALENLVFDRQDGRWRITFAFGLVHGFGFASILREMHLPREGLLASLLAFNLGVEAGQVAVVVLAYPLITAIQRAPGRRAIIGTASAAILVVALFWFVQRTFA